MASHRHLPVISALHVVQGVLAENSLKVRLIRQRESTQLLRVLQLLLLCC